MSSYQQERAVAIEAAQKARTVISDYARKSSFSIELKGKNDLVTDADLAAEKAIISILKEHFPADDILAEESENRPHLTKARTWIIDPIDGTTNFAHSFPVYCVSIALWEHKSPKVGLVYEVANDELFVAEVGKGAFLNDEPIHVSTNSEPSASLIGTGFPYKSFHLLEPYLKMFKRMMRKTHGVRRPGSAAWDLCNVACGRFEGFYEYGLNAWDVAAASLIVEEAGGVVTDWQGKNDWLFGERIIAGNKAIHAFLKAEIHECFVPQDLTENVESTSGA